MQGEIKKKILIIGVSVNDYPRNRVLASALGEVFDTEVLELGNRRLKHLSFATAMVMRGFKKEYIFMIQPAQKFMFWAAIPRFLGRKKIIFDAFFSIYDTYVSDRRLAVGKSLKGVFYNFLDYLSCYLSDVVIFDTEAHKIFFENRLGKTLSKKKKIIIPVSIDLELVEKVKIPSGGGLLSRGEFNVLFCGYYIPLQGVEHIINAAKILEKEKDIKFTLVGSGQEKEKIVPLVKELGLANVDFIEKIIPYEELIKYNKSADLCLGIFGASDKAQRVIPNKVLESMACKKAVVTGRNSEMEKYFKDGEDVIFCEMANSHDLAEKIMYAYKNQGEIKLIGENAYQKIKGFFSKESLKRLLITGL